MSLGMLSSASNEVFLILFLFWGFIFVCFVLFLIKLGVY